MEAYKLVINGSEKYFEAADVLGYYSLGKLVDKITSMSDGDITRIKQYDARYGSLSEWLEHDCSDGCYLSVDIVPAKDDNIFTMFGLPNVPKRLGVTKIEIEL